MCCIIFFFSSFYCFLYRWRATIHHVKQYKQLTDSCSGLNISLECEESKSSSGTTFDELSIIMNIYAECLTRTKNGEYL